MLNLISPLLSPDILDALYRMGHGDEILLADAHFPGDTFGQRVIRADGLSVSQLLEAIAPLFPLDPYVASPLAMMAPTQGDTLDPDVEARFRKALSKPGIEGALSIERVERYAFYKRASECFAVVVTGEMAKYGNIILKKGLAHI